MIDLNPSVSVEDEDRLHAQALTILARLKKGPVSNIQMQKISMQYNARIWEIRNLLEPKGFTVAIIQKQADGVNIYSIVEGVNRKVYRKPKPVKKQTDAVTLNARQVASQAGRDLAKCRHRKKRANKKQMTFNFK